MTKTILVIAALIAFAAGGVFLYRRTLPPPGTDANRRIAPQTGNGRRVALVVGNNAYQSKRLNNAVNDAETMRSALTQADFAVEMLTNTSLRDLESGIDRFLAKVHSGDTALFYYSGHGLQLQDQNYLIPVEFDARTAADAKYAAYPVQRLIDNLEQSQVAMQIVILDACRDNPFRGLRGGAGGLAHMDAGRGAYIAMATAPGKTASDNPTGKNGLFTGELAKVIVQKGLSIDQVFNQTRQRVSQASGNAQVPWSTSSVVGEFYFHAPEKALGFDLDLERYNAVKDSQDPAQLEVAAAKIGRTEIAEILRERAKVLRGQPSEDRRRVNPKDRLTYVWVPPGRFRMGCSAGDQECDSDEKPAKEVEIKKGLWIGQTEVTQAAYERVIGSNPSEFKGGKLPVENVNWLEAGAYCGKVGMRLPTEAEWEYAARAGSESAGYGSVDAIAWYSGNSGYKTHEVGGKEPNVWGLYDMLGNVWEWTSDWYEEGKSRTLRGGSWYNYDRYTRVSNRLRFGPDNRLNDFGFRCIGE